MIKLNRKTKRQIKKKIDVFVVNFFSKVIKPFSRTSRRIFEIARIRQVFGVLVVSSFLSAVVLPASYSIVQTQIDTNFSEIKTIDSEIIETKQSIRIPVEIFSYTQGYSFFHPGIDMASSKGTPVYPIMEGKVTLVNLGRFGYGNHILVDHGSGFKSLYAHLAKIEVEEGEVVSQDSILGLLGSTGWSTGPHLHLQIMEDGRWVNPKAFFESYFGSKLASTR